MKMDEQHPIIDWLLSGDVSVAYQARRDLLGEDRPELRSRIARDGWGAAFLAKRNEGGHWGKGFYEPKWASSHYTLLDLKNLAIDPGHPLIRESIDLISRTQKNADGGIGPCTAKGASDACISGVFLNYGSYFGEKETALRSVVDFLIDQHMEDGGFNCRLNRSGARHSSLHSTISVLEGIHQYRTSGYSYRREEFDAIAEACVGFILLHRLFRSDRTGDVIRPEFLALPYPWRWKYNVLRALDCLAMLGMPWDDRMGEAVAVMTSKRRPDGRWNTNAAHPGNVHFTMERAGQPGRWNTLIAMRALSRLGQLTPPPLKTALSLQTGRWRPVG